MSNIEKDISDIIEGVYSKNSPEHIIYEYISKCQIREFEQRAYYNQIFYCDEDTILFRIDKNNKTLYCAKSIWENIKFNFKLDLEDIRVIIKKVVEDFLKCDVGYVHYFEDYSIKHIEDKILFPMYDEDDDE